jgi:hypothetical protein
VAKPPSKRALSWPFFDRIVADAAPGGVHSNPWTVGQDRQVGFEPDYQTLERLLGVPLHLKAETQSGVPALALDVWLSYELRRAGFGSDQVWPRPTHPRVLPASVSAFIKSLPIRLRDDLGARVTKIPSIPGVTMASANVLGKNYQKQVDVIITDWWTGPELLVSTKRMDSSYRKNAPNRVEEAYGDAKNLRLRHPMAALGLVFGLRSDIFDKEPATADWLFDQLAKLGREDDAYHGTCVVLMEYSGVSAPPEEQSAPPATDMLGAGPDAEGGEDAEGQEDAPAAIPVATIEQVIRNLPAVLIRRDRTPAELAPGRFLGEIVGRMLEITPINLHEEARRRRAEPNEA